MNENTIRFNYVCYNLLMSENKGDLTLGLIEEDLPHKVYYENQEGNKVKLPEGVPYTFKWFSPNSEFHTSPWGDEASPYAGQAKGKIRLGMMGNKLRVTVKNGIGSVYGIITAADNEEDKKLIGLSGWFRIKDLSKEENQSLKRKNS